MSDWLNANIDPESDTRAELQINTSLSIDGKPLDRNWVTVMDSGSLNFSYQLTQVLQWKALVEQQGWAMRFVLTDVNVFYYEMDKIIDSISPACAPDREAWEEMRTAQGLPIGE